MKPPSGYRNVHASAIVLGEAGVLVLGPSGSGKTRLCLRLVEAVRSAAFVADDQVFLAARGEKLVALTPQVIAGFAERRGYGPSEAAWVPAAVIDLVVRLVPTPDAPRLAECATEFIAGVEVPRLDLAARDCEGASLAVLAWIQAHPPRSGEDTGASPAAI